MSTYAAILVLPEAGSCTEKAALILPQGRLLSRLDLLVAGQEKDSLNMGVASLEPESTVALWLRALRQLLATASAVTSRWYCHSFSAEFSS